MSQRGNNVEKLQTFEAMTSTGKKKFTRKGIAEN